MLGSTPRDSAIASSAEDSPIVWLAAAVVLAKPWLPKSSLRASWLPRPYPASRDGPSARNIPAAVQAKKPDAAAEANAARMLRGTCGQVGRHGPVGVPRPPSRSTRTQP